MARDRETVHVVATNRKARHQYLVLEELECGIELRGTEVKSLRAGHCSLAEAYGFLRPGKTGKLELVLRGATIPEYAQGNIHNHEPTRERRLLLNARELKKWSKQVHEKGVTVVPLEVYFKGHLVKVKMALVRGKKLHDKRESAKTRDASREIAREMGRRR